MRGLFPKGWDKAELVERRRSQFISQPPDLGDATLRLGREPAEQGVLRGGIAAVLVTGELEPKRDAGQGRSQTVVQVAAQASAFLFPGADQPLPRALQVGREPYRVGSHACLASQIPQQAAVGRVEALTPRARR